MDFHEDLPAHAVLVTEFENFRPPTLVYIMWIVPKPLDQMAFNAAKLERLSNEVGEARWRSAVDRPWRADWPMRLSQIGPR